MCGRVSHMTVALSSRPLALDAACCLALLGLAVALSSRVWSSPIRWTPDGLAYQAKMLEYAGLPARTAEAQAFALRLRVTAANGGETLTSRANFAKDMRWFRRRIVVSAVAARLRPILGQRSVLAVSLASYVLLGVALYVFLRFRFAPLYAAGSAALALLFPPLQRWSFDPLSDSAGLLCVVLALTAAMLTIRRGRRWLPLWIAVVAIGSITRESIVVPVLTAGLLAARRTPRTMALFLTGVAAMAPAMLFLRFPLRLSFAEVAAHQLHQRVDTSTLGLMKDWALLAARQPLWDFATEPFWTSLLLIALAMVVLTRERSTCSRMIRSAALAGWLYLASFPFITGLRLEFVLLPAATFGLALLAEDVSATVRMWNSPHPTPADASAAR